MPIKIETNELLTIEDLKIFADQTEETLAQWWHKLNCWEWPESLPNEDRLHEDWEAFRGTAGPKRRSLLMDAIKMLIGQRLISWTSNKERMTEDEFDDFFKGNYEGDKEARKRDDKRRMKRVEDEMEAEKKKPLREGEKKST